MITRQTKIQLAVFLALTLAGVSFVGAKYARLDQLLWDTSYDVTAHFADSGGVFSGAEVTYRGVTVGEVGDMQLTDGGGRRHPRDRQRARRHPGRHACARGQPVRGR